MRMTRRDILRTIGSGFGMMSYSRLQAELNPAAGPLAVKPPHFPAKAKHVIYLFLNGGMSQVDTFDPKPMLTKYHGQQAPSGNLKTERKTGTLLKSPFQFHKRGQSGIEVSEIFPQFGALIDDFTVVRSMHTDRPNHEPSLFRLNCGVPLPGHPSMGSWLTYGLGSENQNLPGYVVLSPGYPVIGPELWSSTFLPAVYQGTYIRNDETDPEKLIQNLRNSRLSQGEQRLQLDLLSKLNRKHLEAEGGDRELEASIGSMEIAYRMQTEAFDAFDPRKESEATRARYGDNDFARGCLLARRLVERGVRMVQVYFGEMQPWDNHDDIMIHQKLARQADPAIASLVQDLKANGLFNETIILVGGEFGRTPAVEVSGLVKVQNGRDHNNHGFSLVMGGGGFKGGITYGATDDFGFRAEVDPLDPNDIQATMLHLLGLDHTKLTFRHSGRDYRLTDVHGRVIQELIA